LRYDVIGTDVVIRRDVDGVADLEITLTGVSTLTRDDFAGAPMKVPLTGNAAANTLTGDTGNDVLRGRGGDDLLDGSKADDL
jgi:Ca2+-binding RTX toxin-like protein